MNGSASDGGYGSGAVGVHAEAGALAGSLSAFVAAQRGEGSAEAEAAARRREDFQSEARPGFIESVVTVCPVEG